MGTAWHEIYTVSVGFSRADSDAPDTARAAVLYGARAPISGQADSRGWVPYKEKRTLPGVAADVSHFVCVTAHGRKGLSPCPGSGILTRFPFDTWGLFFLSIDKKGPRRNGVLLSLRTD